MRDNANQPLRASHHSSTILTDKSFKERALTASFYTKKINGILFHTPSPLYMGITDSVPIQKSLGCNCVCDSLLRHAQAVAAHICLCKGYLPPRHWKYHSPHPGLAVLLFSTYFCHGRGALPYSVKAFRLCIFLPVPKIHKLFNIGHSTGIWQ